MNKKDELITLLMIILFGISLWIVMWTDKEIDGLNKTVNYLMSLQETDSERIDQLISDNEHQDFRLDSIEQLNRIQNDRLLQHYRLLTDDAEMFTDLLTSVERLEEHVRSLPDNVLGVSVSDQDIRDIAALVYLEAGSQSYTCQKAIASVIFNRMIKYGMTAQQTIHQNGVFSPANRVSRTRPSASCMMAVREVLETGCTLPRNVVAFRNGHYHSFGRRYTCIDGVYFTSVG